MQVLTSHAHKLVLLSALRKVGWPSRPHGGIDVRIDHDEVKDVSNRSYPSGFHHVVESLWCQRGREEVGHVLVFSSGVPVELRPSNEQIFSKNMPLSKRSQLPP